MRNPGFKERLVLLMAIPMAIGFATPECSDAETLYALERNGSDFAIIDRETGADVATISTEVFGSWRGMATDPTTGTLYASETEYLYTIDPATGGATQIGLFGSVLIRDLTFGAAGVLYGVTGNNGGDQHSLHVINPATGQATLKAGLNGTAGHAIAFDPDEPRVIYHLAVGFEGTVFEKIDLTTNAITPIGLSGDPILNAALGMVFDPLDRVFRLFDSGGLYYSLERDGVVSTIGSNSTSYFGLAFDQRTTQVVLFRDGFEGGDTQAWSGTSP